MVNGDRSARITIEKIGGDGLRLTTVDTDPKTGESVIAAQIDLRRGFKVPWLGRRMFPRWNRPEDQQFLHLRQDEWPPTAGRTA